MYSITKQINPLFSSLHDKLDSVPYLKPTNQTMDQQYYSTLQDSDRFSSGKSISSRHLCL